MIGIIKLQIHYRFVFSSSLVPSYQTLHRHIPEPYIYKKVIRFDALLRCWIGRKFTKCYERSSDQHSYGHAHAVVLPVGFYALGKTFSILSVARLTIEYASIIESVKSKKKHFPPIRYSGLLQS